MAAVARYKAEARTERLVVGLCRARERGSHVGRPFAVTAEQEETVRRLKAEGRKIAAIARAVGVSRPTIHERVVPAEDPTRVYSATPATPSLGSPV